METNDLIQAIDISDLAVVPVTDGITRRDLPTTNNLRGWVIDFAPGSQWPEIDVHDEEERYFVLSGEIIEGSNRFGAGTYVVLAKGSQHRPPSEVGGSMLGLNVVNREAAQAG